MGGTFLLIGILLSVLSRWLEFEDNSTLGCHVVSCNFLYGYGVSLQFTLFQGMVG